VEGGRRFNLSPQLAAALLAALSLSAFSLAVNFPFAGIDDVDYVTDNPHIQHFSLRWALTGFHNGNWHPLTWMSHALDWRMWGPAPAGHHLTSILLHAANGVLLFVFLVRATRLELPSFLTAALFAIHPLRVESVVWISERKDVLSAFFFFLMLLAWLSYVRRPGPARYLAVAALFAAGLAAKPMLVTAPLVLLLLDVWPLQREPRLLEKVPLFVLSAASSFLTLMAQGAGRAITPLQELPLASRVAGAIEGYATYLVKTVWPARLAVHYPIHVGGHWPAWLWSAAALLAITALCAWQRRARPQLLVGWLWFLVMLLPVIGIIHAGSQSVADRYTYLPLIGPIFALAFSLPWERRRPLVVAGAALAVGILFVATMRQERYWRDTRTLFTRTLEISPGDPLAVQALANEAFAAGRLDEAERGNREVLRQWPRAGRALNSLGLIALQRGDLQGALRWFSQALEVEPDPTLVAPAMAATLTHLGRPEEAVRLLGPIESVNPDHAPLQRELGVALAAVGRTKEGEDHLRRAALLAPRDAAVQADLGSLFARTGRFAEAIERFQAALEIDPSFETARRQLDLARRDATTQQGKGH
jgi:tetratricopeptide (TPR) repeat protein